MNGKLYRVLAPISERLNLEAHGDSTGIFANIDVDWPVPDQA